LKYLTIELQKLEIQNDIHKKVKIEIDQQQREYFLTQQMKTIKNELGGDAADIEIGDLRKKASEKNWAQNVADTFEKEVKRLERMHPASPDYSNILTYLHLLLELPWNIFTTDNFDLKNVSKILEKDHFGLEKVKERILEHLAVLKLKGDMKAPIICLYGPPGVGKTSLGKSVAEALNRKYVRISLGGLHDEAEIRGHRKTYIGALPGRIIQNIKKAKSSNPVFILDEIDKIGNDFRGNPSFALLEVLDPEQNSAFYDNYLELEYDLSKVLFIATANSLNSIDSALLDRMELIHVSGYIVEEKIEISKRHLLPKLLENHGINKEQLKFSDEVIEHVIVNYTRESGVRELNNTFAKIARFVAKKIGLEQKYNPKISIKDVRKILGAPIYINRDYQECKYAGVATGLAWTPAGGKILYVETSLSKGNGRLTLTGNLGEVMKESAVIALEYVKAHATDLNIATEIFDTWNLHIHVPEGAIPKDGPSAGITIASSIASAFSQRRVKPHTALTGEITLRGSVLPVGGIKEKILAAKRAQINEIILPAANKNDVEEIKEIYTAGLTFHYVENILEVFNIFLLNEQVENPMVFKKKEIENQKP
jgi:ATP-dependent Lon protease